MEEEEFVIEDEDDSIPKDDETSSVEDINGDVHFFHSMNSGYKC
jgi:hypothetical protein